MPAAPDTIDERRLAVDLAFITRFAPLGFRAARFLLVGLVGLGVDAGGFALLYPDHAGAPLARAASLAIATFVTWALNRRFTFAPTGRPPLAELARYAGVALVAQGFNYLLFLGLHYAAGETRPFACLFAAAALTAFFSFAGQSFFAFGYSRAAPQDSVVTPDFDAIIIGAGPAGLTAAYQLAAARKSTLVLEQDPRHVGGISRTENYKNYLFDIGGHRFFSKSKEVTDLWNEILPDDFIERPRLSRIFYGGKFYSYPLNGFEALRNLGLIESALCMLSYGVAKLRPIANPKTFHQWVRNQFGERLFSIFFKTYTEKVWGMSCDEISADWAAQRIKGLNLGAAVFHSLLRPLRRARRPASGAPVIKTLIESFRYPRKGPGMLWQACAQKIAARGGEIVMGQKLARLSRDDATGLWTVVARDPAGAERSWTSRHVISSAPIVELMNALTPTPLSLFNARALRYRDFLTVALIAKSSRQFPDNWVYIHDPNVRVGRVQNFRSWSPDLVPVDGMTCLGLEYFCFEGDGMWDSPDEALIALAKSEIDHIGLIRSDEVVDACVVRQQKAYPIYDDAYRDNVETVRRDIALCYPNLHLVGRNGMHKYNNQDHAMMTAMLTVRNILAGAEIYDIWDVNEDAEYHEAGASGMIEALQSERLVPRKVA